jgi:DNA-binding transcriptional LysR family regulator
MALKDLLTLRLYTRVARLGSFSAAARESGLAQSQVSRMIAELEASLGARLLSRTTRAVTPTEAGLEFLARMEPILAAVDDAENSVRETGELRGLLRIGMPSTMGIRVVMPRLSAFVARLENGRAAGPRLLSAGPHHAHGGSGVCGFSGEHPEQRPATPIP